MKTKHMARLRNVNIKNALKLVYKYNAQSVSALYDLCTADEFAELFYPLGESPYKYVQIAIDIYSKDCISLQRQNRWNYYLSIAADAEPNEVLELRNFFRVNNIIISEFANAVYNIFNCKLTKINCLRLMGPSNTGKTMIARMLTEIFICAYVNNHNSENEFYLSCFLNKSICLCEELLISQATAEDFKSILGGAPLLISKKFSDKQILNRTPIIVTTNHELFGRGHLSPIDEQALRNRCKTFVFNHNYEPACHITSPALSYLLSLEMNKN